MQTLFCDTGTTVDLAQTFTVLVRLAGWMTERSKVIRERIEKHIKTNTAKAEQVFDKLQPIKSSTYDPLTVVAGELFLDVDSFDPQQTTTQEMREKVVQMGNLANKISDAGDRERALMVMQIVSKIFKQLAAEDAETFNPNFATSLNNLGVRFGELGRREEALKATQDAADLRRELARANPQAFNPNLASSLNNLGNSFSDLGRREEALKATQDAVDLRRELARANPQAFNPNLAMSLNNLGDRFKENDQPQEAHPHYEVAARTLAPYFLSLPAAHVQRMEYMVQDYIQSCQTNNLEPDMELIQPIQQKLKELEA